MNTKYQQNNSQQEPAEDIRFTITKTIWSCATGMLGISIPLVLMTNNSPIIPLFVISGAALGTVAVWRAKGLDGQQNRLGSSPVTEEQLREIEARLADVEVITSFERRLNEKAASERFVTQETAPLGREGAWQE